MNKYDKVLSIFMVGGGGLMAILGGLLPLTRVTWLGIILGLGVYCGGLYLVLWHWWKPGRKEKWTWH